MWKLNFEPENNFALKRLRLAPFIFFEVKTANFIKLLTINLQVLSNKYLIFPKQPNITGKRHTLQTRVRNLEKHQSSAILINFITTF